jgi:Phosphotransferase enzyme family
VHGDPVSAAVAVARASGLRVDEPVVLRDAWHVLVHLAPAPVVARVTSGAPGVDPGDVERELRVAVHAAARGAPVIEPTDLVDPGPHEHDGRTIVFWRFVEQRGDLDPAAAGRGLLWLHDALADFDGELPRAGRRADFGGMLADSAPSRDIELLLELSSRELPTGQALHGDAHLYNCMPGVGGPVWHDLETSCRGPREYDLAALVHSERIHGDDSAGSAALAAYGEHDPELLEAAFLVYAVWIAASWLVASRRRPELADGLERQLAYLRRHRG